MLLRVGILLFLAMLLPMCAVAEASSSGCGFFSVRPDSEALVLDRSGNVKRKVGPGLNSCVPILETVWIEKTSTERREDIEGTWPIDSCDVTVSVVWNIPNLETYYVQGREGVAVSMIQKTAQEALELTKASNVDREELRQHVLATFREKEQSLEAFGVNFIRSFSRYENCILE